MTELYKKYRPKTFNRIVGNEETVAALRNMLNRDTLPHTLLFHGPSGCGKTTLARILKKRLGCGDMDFKEINCSSARGIDFIRETAKTMTLAPSSGTCRIFLLDEVHQLTRDAQHSALKILEDTPRHVYFFLCTTDPQKLLKTILTRCCEMPVRLLTEEELIGLASFVAKRAKVKVSKDTLEELADAASGSARTALVLLDKIANLEEDERSEALKQRMSEEQEAIDLCRALIKKKSWGEITRILKNLKTDPEKTRWAVMTYARKVLLDSRNAQAYLIICAFENNFYDSKEAGLIRACYEATFGDS